MEVERLLTLEEYEALPDDGSHAELLRGRLQSGPPLDDDAGRFLRRLSALMDTDRSAAGTGRLVRGAHFLLSVDPPTILSPALAYVTREHLPRPGARHLTGAPDLAVEIAYRPEHSEALHDRALEYIDAGARAVWVVEADQERVSVYQNGRGVTVRARGDILDADVLLPGLLVPVADLFRESPTAEV
ncbi:MAG TPA: Uma2 family endonuclease [Longimicrobiales bacterium]|nr:Uma2 family endonuclease [Longimicrobiales bacterium]